MSQVSEPTLKQESTQHRMDPEYDVELEKGVKCNLLISYQLAYVHIKKIELL